MENTWIHIVVEIDGMMITDSIRVANAADLADHIARHVNNGGDIIAITTSEEWNAQKAPDLSSDDLDAWAQELEAEISE
ncbi:MAG: hypothetical protein Unbinned627contig1001_17 [Prokaryotic dsDNA virus sp.]|jgi:hypothetical protein|nr:MAG: hypothetical protein Unbinned627contig1001_17 [Prokaryotic dsDNA virus sp.]|tara:strand:- start:2678 stop:2914 length:237 start_codon:yes stop_codon:yes gene_type:complete